MRFVADKQKEETMNERSLYARVAKALNNPTAIGLLRIGNVPGRFVKPRDGWGVGKDGAMVRIPNPVDFYWTTDCLELKAVKAKTKRGWTFKAKQVDGQQLDYVQKHNALFACAFIEAGEKDRLIAIPVLR